MPEPQARRSPSQRLADRSVEGSAADALSTADLANALLDRLPAEEPRAKRNERLATLLGMLSRKIDLAVGDRHANRFGTGRSLLPMINEHPDIHIPPTATQPPSTVVEIGCGGLHPIGAIAQLLVMGYRGISIDLDPLEDPALAARSAFASLTDAIVRARRMPSLPIDWARLRQGDLDAIPSEVWRYVATSADTTGLEDASVDLVLSLSFLEHVPDPAAVVRETARILRPGQYAVHQIDLQDHSAYLEPKRHPLDFLTIETDEPLVRGCNRLRHEDFVSLFEGAGFEMRQSVVRRRIDLDGAFLQSVLPRFRDNERDLSILGVCYFLRRR